MQHHCCIKQLKIYLILHNIPNCITNIKNKYVSFLQIQVVLINVVQVLIVIIVSNVKIIQLWLLNVYAENLFVLNVKVMIILHVHVHRKINGLKLCWNNKLMLNGLPRIQNYVHGVIKLCRDHKVVILWLVYVAKVFVICVVNLGNLIIRIISNVISIKNVMMIKSADRKQFYKN